MSTPQSLLPPRILVAEDDVRVGRTLGFLLQRHGYEVVTADDGQAALDILLAPDAPSLALLDWEMPRLDGLHVARAVRTVPAQHYTYLIMVTARDSATDVLDAFGAGVDDFLAKPVDAAQLLARLRCGRRVLALEERLANRVAELEHTLEEVSQLKRLLPICSYCKKVREDGDYWQEIESFLHQHAGSDFSHAICPECLDAVVNRDDATHPMVRLLDPALRADAPPPRA